MKNKQIGLIFLLSLALCGFTPGGNPAFGSTAGGDDAPADQPIAAEKVRFPSLNGEMTSGAPAILDGYLFRPAGSGPFPAVVALHGCSGLFTRAGKIAAIYTDWAKHLVRSGYLLLFPDSFTTRGLREICTQKEGAVAGIPFRERPRDAYGALVWLQKQPFVRKDRIALMGWSNGGSSVLATVDAASAARPSPFSGDFRAAIAFYPGCRAISRMARWKTEIPLTILIGEADDWTPASSCISLTDRMKKAGAPVEIRTYPGAYHGFDGPDRPAIRLKGLARTPSGDGTATVGPNPEARADAIARVDALLARYLKP